MLQFKCKLPNLLACIALSSLTCFPLLASSLTIPVSVGGQDGPWNYVNGGLNTNYQYGVDDQLSPVVVNSGNGFSFTAGSQFTLTYVSGFVSAGPGFPAVDANGDTAAPFNNSPGSSGKVAPSYYMNPNTYPINLVELVGTFTNSSGAIVGTPFAIGDGPFTTTVPAGSTALQLGINDDIFHDNTGSFVVDVQGQAGAATPEPSSMVLLSLGLTSVGVIGRIAKRSRKD